MIDFDNIEIPETGIEEIVLDLVENYRMVINRFKADFKNVELSGLEVKIDGEIFDLDDFKGEARYAIDSLTSEILMLGGDVEKCLFKVQNIINEKEDIDSGFDEWRTLEPKDIDYEKAVFEIAELYKSILQAFSRENAKIRFDFGISDRFSADEQEIGFDDIDFSLEENFALAETLSKIGRNIVELECVCGKTEEEILIDVEKFLNGERK